MPFLKKSADEKGPLGVAEVFAAEQSVVRSGEPGPMHTSAPLSALCISGGGIRSATFALGAIQEMARRGLLTQFDYLSTVSGGGFVGAWLSAWAKRSPGGIGQVAEVLSQSGASDSSDAGTAGPLAPLDHLRKYNSYLTPRSGAFSTDMWTLLATIFRNIVLNWLVLLPMLMLLLMVPRLLAAALSLAERKYGSVIYVRGERPNWGHPALNEFSTSPVVDWGSPLTAAVLLAVALFHTLRFLPGGGNVKHTRSQFNVWILLPLFGAVLCFLANDSYYYVGRNYIPDGYSSIWNVIKWTLVPCGAAWVAAFALDERPVGLRVRRFAGLAVALALLGLGTAVSVWLASNLALWKSNDPDGAAPWAEVVTFGPSAALFSFVVGIFLFVGLSSRVLKDDAREWLSRCAGTILLFCAGWTALCAVVLLIPRFGDELLARGVSPVVGLAGISAWLSKLGSPAPSAGAQGARGKGAVLLKFAVTLAPVLFLVLLSWGLVEATNKILYAVHAVATRRGGMDVLTLVSAKSWISVEPGNHTLHTLGAHPALIGLVMLAFLGFAVLASRYININTFSLNGMYRDRLVRAYLGASNDKRRDDTNPFTDIDPQDDLRVTALAGQRPLHVVNLTLNLADGTRLAWQQRKATSFTVSPLHCGSAEVGYRPSAQYAGGISLGTAMAISGAAASPNMGYHSSPLVGFIMTLFNARLGAWLGNPGRAGQRTWMEPGPRSAVSSMVKEALGQTSARNEYVYLSDGGHFENLALYEMVRRRCKLIVVLDGGGDPLFRYDDLGNALRKIRIDFGVSIDFDGASGMHRLLDKEQRFAVGTIRYAAVDGPRATDGRILYIKPIMLGGEGPDVLSYAAQNPAFPHQSTGDQAFDESQTESYRSLGRHTMNDVCRGFDRDNLGELLDYLERQGAATTTQG